MRQPTIHQMREKKKSSRKSRGSRKVTISMILEIFVSLVRTKQSVIIYPNRKFGKFHKSHFFINDRHSAAPFHVWRIAVECGYMKRFFLYFLNISDSFQYITNV
jgi:hypothetical protein